MSNLLSFDRSAVTETIDPNAQTYSDIGLCTVAVRGGATMSVGGFF